MVKMIYLSPNYRDREDISFGEAQPRWLISVHQHRVVYQTIISRIYKKLYKKKKKELLYNEVCKQLFLKTKYVRI